MCIIILNCDGVLPKHVVYNSWDANQDGAGLAWADGVKIHVEKEMSSKKRFYKMYLAAREKTTLPIMLHFRIGTSGLKDLTNCHPFVVNKNLVFSHNGIISQFSEKSKFSDTYLFNEVILRRLPVSFLKNTAICTLLSDYIDKSKLCFLHVSGEYTIINEELGHWNGENWFSNHSYEYEQPKFYGGSWNYKNDLIYCCYCGKLLINKADKDIGLCNECFMEAWQLGEN